MVCLSNMGANLDSEPVSDHLTLKQALNSVNTSPNRQDFGPPPIPTDSASTTTMNYSPKHSRKLSSLSISRNINMKHLSLSLSSASSSPSHESSSVNGHNNDSFVGSSPPQNGSKRPPVLAIPQDFSISAPLVTPNVAQTPLIPPAPIQLRAREHSSRSSPILPPSEFNLGVSPPHFAPGSPDNALSSPFGSQLAHQTKTSTEHSPSSLGRNAISGRHTSSRNGPFHAPEELQEQSNLHAYPNGPARVLNNTLFLYSDPKSSLKPIDINDYDLVVNVAKDSEDLRGEFDTKGGKRTYLYIPWSHTSSISEELPRITQTIAKYDKPGMKTLVHCQCGVSRSACVVVAYFMIKFSLTVNEAYELLKSGTANLSEPCNRRIAQQGYHVDACERICPNMSLIFELMDFEAHVKSTS